MRAALLCLLAILLSSAPALAQEEKSPEFPLPKSDLPHPFYSYMATGKKKGRFHCLITEHDLNPVVMILVRGTEVTPSLKFLLVKLNNAIDRNPNTRLAGFAIFLTDKIKDLVREDDAREDLEKKLEDVAEGIRRDSGLSHVTFALNVKERLSKYKAEEFEIIVLLYNRYRVVSFHGLKSDQLTDDKVKEILGEIAEKLGARR